MLVERLFVSVICGKLAPHLSLWASVRLSVLCVVVEIQEEAFS